MSRLPLVSPLDRILFLKAQRYLEGQKPEVLTALASYTEERYHAADSLVRPASRRLEEVLFLAEGVVRVATAFPDAPRTVEAPGVIGIPHSAARSTDVPEIHAVEDTLLLAIEIDDMDQILDEHVSLLLNFARRTSEQARDSERVLGADRPDVPGFDAEDAFGTPVELDLVHRLARARRAPFFRETNLTVLGQLIRYAKVRHVAKEERLWSVGDEVRSMTLVLDGEFYSEGDFARAVAPAGAVVGALEILSESPREEAWVASLPSRVLDIRRDHFVDLLEDEPDFARAYHAYCSRATLAAWKREGERRATGPPTTASATTSTSTTIPTPSD